MDFIDGLPQSRHVNCILVIVDKFTKFAHLLTLAHPYTASKVALLYMNQVYWLHGFLGAIISDRYPVFTSHFWQELFKYAGTGLWMNSVNHPQTDGQTKWVMFRDFPLLLYSGLPSSMEPLVASCPILVQFSAPLCYQHVTILWYVQARAAPMGAHHHHQHPSCAVSEVLAR